MSSLATGLTMVCCLYNTPRMKLLTSIALAAVLAGATPAYAQAAWDAAPWIEDLHAVRDAMLTKYANRDWLERERGVPIADSFERIEARMRVAGSDAAARALLDRTMRYIDDGHVTLRWPEPPHAAPTPSPAEAMTVERFCAARGYSADASPGIMPALPGYRPVRDAQLLSTGVVEQDGIRIGALRIGLFSPHAFPALCVDTVAALDLPIEAPCDDACENMLVTETYRRLTETMMDRLEELDRLGADVLIVDITDNGGGSDWVDAAARMLSATPLQAAPTGFVRGEHWRTLWSRTADQLREAVQTTSPADRARLLAWIEQAEQAKDEADTPCDPSTGCAWLGRAGFATGLVASAADGAFAGRPWAPYVFNSAQHGYRSGVWRKPVIVLTDQESWSAAEQFAAMLQDNDAAVILGARTGGAGCGHSWGGTPTTLPNSRAVFQVPDCARFRRDGSNEVAGVIPDVLIGWKANEGQVLRARLLAEKLPIAVVEAMNAHDRR